MSNALFALAALGYWAAAAGYQYLLFHQGRGRPDWKRWTRLMQGSHAIHTVALIVLAVQLGHLPMVTMNEAVATVGWALVGLYAVLGRAWKVEALGSVAAPAAAVLTTYAAIALGRSENTPTQGAWGVLHVGSFVASYAAFFLAVFCAALYFVQSRRLKAKKLSSAFSLPSLDTLDRAGFRFILIGFPLLLLGFVSGTLLHGWHWTWDAKEIMVAVTCVFYLAYLHLRMVNGWAGRRINLLLLASSAFVAISLLAPGQNHSY